jgi:hypothetical protein
MREEEKGRENERNGKEQEEDLKENGWGKGEEGCK